METEASHLGLALLVGTEDDALTLPGVGRDGGEGSEEAGGGRVLGSGRIDREAADADDEGIGTLAAGDAALVGLDAAVELFECDQNPWLGP